MAKRNSTVIIVFDITFIAQHNLSNNRKHTHTAHTFQPKTIIDVVHTAKRCGIVAIIVNTHTLTWPNTTVASSAYTLLSTSSKHWLCCVVFFPHIAKKSVTATTQAHRKKTFWQPNPPNTHYFTICWLYIHANTHSRPNIISAGIFWKFQTVNQPATHTRARTHTESQHRPDTSGRPNQNLAPYAFSFTPLCLW